VTAIVARFLRDRSGSTAIEYAVIGSLVSVALVLAATTIGTQLNGMIGAIVGYFR
jgi:pilus assembly protein Flp/PilA